MAFQKVWDIVVNHPAQYYGLQEQVTAKNIYKCDAFEYGLRVALEQNGQKVAFASQPLSQTETQYAFIEKEC